MHKNVIRHMYLLILAQPYKEFQKEKKKKALFN